MDAKGTAQAESITTKQFRPTAWRTTTWWEKGRKEGQSGDEIEEGWWRWEGLGK